MAHTKQSAKRNRQNIKARTRNRAQRSTMKTAIRAVRRADSADTAKAALPEAMKKIDKAAKRRVIHPNAAARLKSRLAKKIASGR
ncbi:MAG: 30S ribosomal protein S20 [Planctomycetes bacterium]|nr:30S ribosomal protein S20 [Planctomycetota bacterium]